MGRRRIHAAFILYKTLGYPELGYTMATGTGFLRIYNNRHWLTDVITGAGIGIFSVKLSYWLYPKIFTEKRNRKGVFVAPLYDGKNIGATAQIIF